MHRSSRPWRPARCLPRRSAASLDSLLRRGDCRLRNHKSEKGDEYEWRSSAHGTSLRRRVAPRRDAGRTACTGRV